MILNFMRVGTNEEGNNMKIENNNNKMKIVMLQVLVKVKDKENVMYVEVLTIYYLTVLRRIPNLEMNGM